DYGKRFYVGGRKVSLNFALAEENSFDPSVLIELFDPDVFMVKVTPVNPTDHARRNDMVRENLSEEEIPAISILRENGFDVVVSIGDLRENEIGSNCGQLAALWKKGNME
ncbi:MAG: radical SAM protein, partial [Thermoplasmata archaeon]|nr:radical SAM protein [Thermoplasmata archaeon]